MKKIEVGKSYKTRDGREVRVYDVDGFGVYPIYGSVFTGERNWVPYSWSEVGSHLGREDSDCDIVMEPLKFEGVARIDSYFEGGNPKIYVPIEFAGLEVKFTLEVLEPTENEKLEQLRARDKLQTKNK